MPSDYTEEHAWWKEAVVYQIYPISFFDSNGDGFGDLNGITSKLDYIKNELGANVIWLSPIYKSPLADMGYDIADYRAIDERYGTLEDWDNLLKGVHDREMKLMMDLVVNHTSDEHEWFIQSRKSKDDNPKRDWYIWRPARSGEDGVEEPNNWRSMFEGSAWEYDSTTSEYYLHLWDKKQPDLNWENPDVRDAVWDLMKFWLDRGCDGFRMDVINVISKTPGLPDAPITEPNEKYQRGSVYFANGPRVHEFIKEMNSKVLSQYTTITVGETPFTENTDDLVKYVLPDRNELKMVFQFELMYVDAPTALKPGSLASGTASGAGGGEGDGVGVGDSEDDGVWAQVELFHRDWKLSEFKKIVEKWQTLKMKEGYWNATYIENHDQARSVTRFGNDTTDDLQAKSAKMLAMFHATQRGTLYVFQGQELGLKNAPKSWGIEDYPDVATRNFYNKVLEERRREYGTENPSMEDIMDGIQWKARDHARIPLSWDDSANGGFTTGKPWMRVHDDYKTWNAADQMRSDESVLAYWRKALKLRREYAVLVYGDFTLLFPEHEQIFAYIRHATKPHPSTAFVLMNMSRDPARVQLPKTLNLGAAWAEFECVLTNSKLNSDAPALDGEEFLLQPYEGRIYIAKK